MLKQYLGFTYRFANNGFFQNLLMTLFLLFLVLLTRFLLVRMLSASKSLTMDVKRMWVIRSRSIALIIFLLSSSAIWSNELKTFAITLTALAAAIAIATKELILSYCGTILKALSHPFSQGDRIEVNGVRGDVIDETLLTTTVLEIGPHDLTHQYTGRSVVIPNMLFLLHPVINETFFHNFVLHTFRVPSTLQTWREDEQALLKACTFECEQYIEQAQREMDKRTRKKQLGSMSVRPRILIKPQSRSDIILVARVAVPIEFKSRIENAIIKRYLDTISPNR